jgi:hypothetical protein
MCPVRSVTYVSGRSQAHKLHFWFFRLTAVDDFVDGEIPRGKQAREKLNIRLTAHQSATLSGRLKSQ